VATVNGARGASRPGAAIRLNVRIYAMIICCKYLRIEPPTPAFSRLSCSVGKSFISTNVDHALRPAKVRIAGVRRRDLHWPRDHDRAFSCLKTAFEDRCWLLLRGVKVDPGSIVGVTKHASKSAFNGWGWRQLEARTYKSFLPAVTLYFDPCAFSLQPTGFLGNAGRNILTGPGFANLDFSIVKDTHISHRGNKGCCSSARKSSTFSTTRTSVLARLTTRTESYSRARVRIPPRGCSFKPRAPAGRSSLR
jgi:hypothetical protein